jgi:RNA recognition motif-containing protein
LQNNQRFDEEWSDDRATPGETSSTATRENNGAGTTTINEYKLFVGGLCYATGHESLRKYFGRFGEVSKAQVMYNRTTKASRGFGFVLFSDADAVEKVLTEGTVHVVDGSDVEVKRCRRENFKSRHMQASRPYDSAHSTEGYSAAHKPGDVMAYSKADSAGDCINRYKVFVGGLSYVTGNEVLRQYFSKFGEVVSAEVMYNRSTRASRGFGFILFKYPESVDQVLEQGNLHVVHGNHVEVKRCRRSPTEISNIRRFGKYSRAASQHAGGMVVGDHGQNHPMQAHHARQMHHHPPDQQQQQYAPQMRYPVYGNQQQPFHNPLGSQQHPDGSVGPVPPSAVSAQFYPPSDTSPWESSAQNAAASYGYNDAYNMQQGGPPTPPIQLNSTFGSLSLSSSRPAHHNQLPQPFLPPSVAAALAVVEDNGENAAASSKKPNDGISGILATLDLSKYAEIFEKEEVSDLKTLSMLSDEDLKVMGVPKGPRVKILEYVSRIGGDSESAPLSWLDGYFPGMPGMSQSFQKSSMDDAK